jgi:hypothetical protein
MERGRPSRLDYAVRYAELGYKSFPLRVRVQPGGDGELEKKLFPVLDWPRVATCDRAKVESWWGDGQAWATASIGIATGQSGIAVIDPDGPEGLAEWQQIRDLYGISDDTSHYSTPGGGEHWWYRTDPARPLPTGARTVADHVDTRGGYGPDGNGLVIVPPSTDDRGAYRWIVEPVALDDLPPVPEAVYALIDDRKGVKPREADPEQALPGDGTRRYTLAQAQAFIRPAIEAIERADKGTRNDRLNDAARVAAHFGGEFWSREQAEQRLTDLARERGLDSKEIADTIDSAYKAQARDYASGEVDKHGRPKGWTATYVEPSPFGDDEEGEEVDPFETEVEREVQRLRVREEAARRFRTEQRSHRPRIEDGIIDDLDSIELPAMLLDSLIPDHAIGFLTGRSGGYKSFLATSWGCCIATGKPWLGRSEFAVSRPLKTLYVAAEGAAGAAARMKAWETFNGTSRRGKLLLYKRPIHLNDRGQAEELAEYIAKASIEFLIVDTYHRSAPGSEENSSTEFGVVFEAVAAIRDDHGCGVLFLDHTGHAGERTRGTSAKEDDADYVVVASYQGNERGPDVQRTLKVRKLKDQETDAEWPVKLTMPTGAQFPVAVIGELEHGIDPDDWADQLKWPLPGDVMTLEPKADKDGRVRGRDAIPPLAMFMRLHAPAVEGAVGIDRREATKAIVRATGLGERPVHNAWSALMEGGRLSTAAGVRARTGRHVWASLDDDPKPIL